MMRFRNGGSRFGHGTKKLRSPVSRGRPVQVEALEERRLMTVYAVTNTFDGSGDGPSGSLRNAIVSSNAAPGVNDIIFQIPGGGVKTIELRSPLPATLGVLRIDATSQPGYAGTPLIELNGAKAGANADGLTLNGNGSILRGLAINNFSRDGLVVGGGALIVTGNFIGTDPTGVATRPNGRYGIRVVGNSNSIGGPSPGQRNVISANGASGVALLNPSSKFNSIVGNYIGTNAFNTAPLGNTGAGIVVDGAQTTIIGGSNQVDQFRNVIAFNHGPGVSILSGDSTAVLGNSIYHNDGLGIDLLGDGVTLNDPGDIDTGPNGLLNIPVVTTAVSVGNTLAVFGSLNSTPNTSFTIQLYASIDLDPSGYGEGQKYLGALDVKTSAGGNVSFVFQHFAVPLGWFISAVALRFNDASEFSRGEQVVGQGGAPANAPPRVDGVFLGSTQWQTQFTSYLETRENGSGFGLLLPAVQPNPYGFTNIDQVSVRFDQNVSVTLADASVRDQNNNDIPIKSFKYDPITFTATFSLGRALQNGHYTIGLRSGRVGIENGSGILLDGEFNDAYPSGNGHEGGSFLFPFSVLPGDVNGSGGSVNASDLVITRNRIGHTAANPGTGPTAYNAMGDVNGDGTINAAELVLVRNRIGTSLPPIRTNFFSITPIESRSLRQLSEESGLL